MKGSKSGKSGSRSGRNAKTAASTAKVDPAALVASAATGPEKRIVPLGGGTWAWVRAADSGRTIHVKVASDRFDEVISQQAGLSEMYAERLGRELGSISLGDFPKAAERLRDKGVLPV